MTYLTLILATLAVRALISRLSARRRRPKFPHDICTGCTNPPYTGPQRRERSDEYVDRLARRIHARHVREELATVSRKRNA